MEAPFDGGPTQRLTEKAFSWPSISPDGKWIACGFATPVKYQLAIIPIDGGEPAKFFDSAPLANIRLGIRWAGDGKSVLYRDQRVGLWRQTLDGGTPTRIPGLPPEKIYGFGWSRDNKFWRIRSAQKFATCCYSPTATDFRFSEHLLNNAPKHWERGRPRPHPRSLGEAL